MVGAPGIFTHSQELMDITIDRLMDLPDWYPAPHMLKPNQTTWSRYDAQGIKIDPKEFLWALSPAGNLQKVSVRTNGLDVRNPEHAKLGADITSGYYDRKVMRKRAAGWIFIKDPDVWRYWADDPVRPTQESVDRNIARWRRGEASAMPDQVKEHLERVCKELKERREKHNAEQAAAAERTTSIEAKAVKSSQDLAEAIKAAVADGKLLEKVTTTAKRRPKAPVQG